MGRLGAGRRGGHPRHPRRGLARKARGTGQRASRRASKCLLACRARPLPLLGVERRHAHGQVEQSKAAASHGGDEQRRGKLLVGPSRQWWKGREEAERAVAVLG